MNAPLSASPQTHLNLANANAPSDRPSALLSFVPGKPRRLPPSEADALFAAMLAERQRELTALVYGITGDYHASQDIVQEVYIKLHRFLARGKVDGRLVGWLRKVARNAALDHRRKRLRANLTLTSEFLDLPAQTPALSDADTHLCHCLAQLLKQLPDRHREVFELRAMDERSFGQIAIQMNLSETNCRSIYHRVCKRLCKAGTTSMGAMATMGQRVRAEEKCQPLTGRLARFYSVHAAKAEEAAATKPTPQTYE